MGEGLSKARRKVPWKQVRKTKHNEKRENIKLAKTNLMGNHSVCNMI
jgi:hypothetical protein